MESNRLNSGFTKLALVFSLAFASAGIAYNANAASLTLYNGQHREAAQVLIDGFTAKTGIDVEVRDGKGNELAHQIVEEGDKSPADVIYTEETSPIIMLGNDGMLAQIDAATLESIPAEYRGKENNWIGILGRSRVIVYNPDLIAEAELPKSIMELSDSKWKDKFAYVATSGSFQNQVSGMIKLEGKEKTLDWLKGLKENGKVYRKHNMIVDVVDRGDLPFGLINNYYWDRQVKEKGIENLNSRLYFFGNGDIGDMLTIASMAILKSSPNNAEAQKFLEYAVSVEGQKLLTDASAQYPLNLAVESHPDLKPFSELNPPQETMDLGELADGKAAVALMQEAGLL